MSAPSRHHRRHASSTSTSPIGRSASHDATAGAAQQHLKVVSKSVPPHPRGSVPLITSTDTRSLANAQSPSHSHSASTSSSSDSGSDNSGQIAAELDAKVDGLSEQVETKQNGNAEGSEPQKREREDDDVISRFMKKEKLCSYFTSEMDLVYLLREISESLGAFSGMVSCYILTPRDLINTSCGQC